MMEWRGARINAGLGNKPSKMDQISRMKTGTTATTGNKRNYVP